MTTRSLRPILEGRATSNRNFISSGLQSDQFASSVAEEQAEGNALTVEHGHGYNWRLVITHNETTILKFICCKGRCNGSPSTAPGPNSRGWTQLLYNVLEDEFDMHGMIAPVSCAVCGTTD